MTNPRYGIASPVIGVRAMVSYHSERQEPFSFGGSREAKKSWLGDDREEVLPDVSEFPAPSSEPKHYRSSLTLARWPRHPTYSPMHA